MLVNLFEIKGGRPILVESYLINLHVSTAFFFVFLQIFCLNLVVGAYDF